MTAEEALKISPLIIHNSGKLCRHNGVTLVDMLGCRASGYLVDDFKPFFFPTVAPVEPSEPAPKMFTEDEVRDVAKATWLHLANKFSKALAGINSLTGFSMCTELFNINRSFDEYWTHYFDHNFQAQKEEA